MAWASQKYDVKLMGAVTKCFRKWQAQAASQDKIVIKYFATAWLITSSVKLTLNCLPNQAPIKSDKSVFC